MNDMKMNEWMNEINKMHIIIQRWDWLKCIKNDFFCFSFLFSFLLHSLSFSFQLKSFSEQDLFYFIHNLFQIKNFQFVYNIFVVYNISKKILCVFLNLHVLYVNFVRYTYTYIYINNNKNKNIVVCIL